jgi:hypothetical protein
MDTAVNRRIDCVVDDEPDRRGQDMQTVGRAGADSATIAGTRRAPFVCSPSISGSLLASDVLVVRALLSVAGTLVAGVASLILPLLALLGLILTCPAA